MTAPDPARRTLQLVVLAVAVLALVGGLFWAAGNDVDPSDAEMASMTTDTLPPSTTVVPTTSSTMVRGPWDARIPGAVDLGLDFVYMRSTEELGGGPCTVPAPEDSVSIEHQVTAYSSNRALEQAQLDLFGYGDVATAEAAWATMRAGSSCPVDGNHEPDGALPTDVTVVGADAAFAIGFVDPADGVGTTVALVDTTVVVATARFHFGETSDNGITATALAELAAARLDPARLAATGDDLDHATAAIRQACRRFYGADHDPTGPSRTLTEPELVERCDEPEVEFRSDCYAERPPTFVDGVGGCAVLGGYLAVYAGVPPETDPVNTFEVDGTTWAIHPESD